MFIPSLNTIKWACVALCVAAIWGAGHRSGKAALEPKLRAAEQQVEGLKLALDRAAGSQRIVTQYVDRLIEVKGAARVITKELPSLVTPAADRACVLPVGFVRLHDQAAAGFASPAGTDESDPSVGADQPSGKSLSFAAEVITDNYARYHEVAAQCTALQEWVKVNHPTPKP